MSYIGQTLPADTFQGFTTDSFAGDGSATTFTLSKTPFNESALLVVINNVVQKPTTNFTVSGTTLTIVGTAVASGDVIYATHIGGALPIGQAASLDLNGASDQLILDADADTTISADTDDQIDFKAGGVDEMTMSSSGIVINESSNDRDFRIESNGKENMFFVDGGNDRIGINTTGQANNMVNIEDVTGNGGGTLGLSCPTSGTSDNCGRLHFGNATDPVVAAIFGIADGANDAGALTFRTEATGAALEERMRINSSGYVGIGTTNVTSPFMTSVSAHNTAIAAFVNSTGSTPYGIYNSFSGAAPDNHTAYFLYCVDNAAVRCIIQSDGDLNNHDNTYGQTSDERIKSNITDANSQWDDIKAIKFRNFERKDDIAQYGNGKKVQIGVVAQEIEKISPGLVKEAEPRAEDIKMSSEFGTLYTSDDTETQDAVLYKSSDQEVIDGDKNVGDVKTRPTKEIGDIKTTTGEKVKSVSYSVLYVKAVKALQEAMAKIETLETKVKALEDA